MTSKNLLPSWQPGLARDAILEFIERVTHPESLDFVPQEQRIATFDNDGTLWPEKPDITELVFLKDLMRFDEPGSLPIGAGLRQKIKHWLHHIHDELIEHTDDIREYRYSPGDDTLAAAIAHGWTRVDMRRDWQQVFS